MKKNEREWKGKGVDYRLFLLGVGGRSSVLSLVVSFEVEIEYKFTLSSLEVLQGFSFFLQMGFTLILATLDGLGCGFCERMSLVRVTCDDDDCDEEMSIGREC
ncbi:hypothetical protein Tco_0377100 [Tanacetum coccineum]